MNGKTKENMDYKKKTANIALAANRPKRESEQAAASSGVVICNSRKP